MTSTSMIPPKALALLAADVELLEKGTAEEARDFTTYKADPAGILAILDESSGVPRHALNALESCLEDPTRDRIISAGNPLNLDGFFPSLFRPDSGWKTFHISAYDCPAYTGEGEPYRVGKTA